MLLIRLLDAMNRVSTGGKMFLYYPFYKLGNTHLLRFQAFRRDKSRLYRWENDFILPFL